jgi:hypothetical protein
LSCCAPPKRSSIAQGITALTSADAVATITARIEDTGEHLTLSHDFSEHDRAVLITGVPPPA